MDVLQLSQAEELLEKQLAVDPADHDAYYLLGNLHRKRGNWQEALQSYAHAIEINPESPAVHARKMINQIMDFYDKERYNV